MRKKEKNIHDRSFPFPFFQTTLTFRNVPPRCCPPFQARVNDAVGAVQIGLWQACADMPCSLSDDDIVKNDDDIVDPEEAKCKFEP